MGPSAVPPHDGVGDPRGRDDPRHAAADEPSRARVLGQQGGGERHDAEHPPEDGEPDRDVLEVGQLPIAAHQVDRRIAALEEAAQPAHGRADGKHGGRGPQGHRRADPQQVRRRGSLVTDHRPTRHEHRGRRGDQRDHRLGVAEHHHLGPDHVPSQAVLDLGDLAEEVTVTRGGELQDELGSRGIVERAPFGAVVRARCCSSTRAR